jgi:hypothetical protein
MSAIGWHDRPQGLLRSEQRLDRCDSHQILRGIGELPIERDQSVGLELGQSDVLGVMMLATFLMSPMTTASWGSAP